MLLTGRRVSGPEAYFIGLCDRLVEVVPEEMEKPGVAREKVLKEAVDLAMGICEGGPVAIKWALKAVEGFESHGDRIENEAYGQVLRTDDRIEALRAFVERRKPAFRGK